jgi:hypothetical protein
MNFSTESIPELAALERRERWRMLAKCHLRSFLHWETWAGLLLAVVISAVAQVSVRYLLPALTERTAPLLGFSPAVAGWIVGGHLSWNIRVRVVRRLVRKELPHLCQGCGYDLRATPSQCPECGLVPGTVVPMPPKTVSSAA